MLCELVDALELDAGEERKRPEVFASKNGIPWSTLRAWMVGVSRPTLDVAFALQSTTRIPLQAWAIAPQKPAPVDVEEKHTPGRSSRIAPRSAAE